MRLHCPYSKECHCHKVTKATPDLSPKGGGGQEHGARTAKRERHLYRVGQLGRIWQGLSCPNPSCAILRRFQVNAVRWKDAIRPVEESSLMAACRLEVASLSYL